MKKKALRKDFYMEVKKSLNRFLSIMLIVAMGVAFYSGIQSAAPDMRYSGDAYFDEHHLMDLKVVGTLGLTDGDVEALKALHGVEKAEPGYMLDVLCGDEEAQQVLHVESISPTMNQLTAEEGRLPEASGEVFVDIEFLDKGGYKIGDTITFYREEEDDLILKRAEYTIVGAGSSPLYISFNRGNTNLGNGEISGAAYILPEDFDSEVYTQIYLEVQDARNLTAYTDAYDTLIERVTEEVEGIAAERCQIRYQDVTDEANEKLADAEKELEDGKKEAESELAEAESELEKGRQELADAKQEVADAEKELEDGEKEIAENKATLQEKEQELADGKAQLESGWAQLASGKEELAEKEAEFNKKYASGMKEIQSGEAQLEEAKEQLQAGKAQYESEKSKYEEGKAQYEAGEAAYSQGLAEYEAGEAAYSKGKTEYEAGAAQWQTQKATLESQRAEALSTKNTLESGIAGLNASLEAAKNEESQAQNNRDNIAAQLNDAKKKLESAKEDDKAGIQAQIDSLTGQLSQAESTLTEATEKVTSLQGQISDMTGQLETVKSSISQLDSAISQGDQAIATSKQNLDDSRAQLDSSKATLSQTRETLDATKAQLEAAPAALEKAEAKIAAGEKEIAANEQKLKDARTQLSSAQAQITSAKNTLAASEQKLNDSQAQITDGEAQIADGKSQIEEAEKKLAEGKQEVADAKKEIEDGEKELSDGEKEYEDGKKEADDQIAEGEEKIADAKKEIADLEEPEWVVSDRSSLPENIGYGENADRMRAIGQVFPVLFFLVAALISLTTMTRMVEEERTQIGTLKALGYSKTSIAAKYICYALVATLVGSIMGVLFGEKFLPFVIVTAYKIMYHHMPNIELPYNMKFALLGSGAALISTIGATVAACYKELASTPAVLMRPPAPKEGKRVLLERIPFIWRRLNFTWKSTVRNLLRYKKRFFMTVFGIGGCMALMITGYGLRDSISDIAVLQYNELQLYEGMVIMDSGATEEEKEQLVKSVAADSRVDQSMEVLMEKDTVHNGKKMWDLYLMVPRDAAEFTDFVTFQDRVTKESYDFTDEGAIITEKIAKMMGVKAGDTIVLENEDEGNVEIPIAAVTENYLSHYIYVTPALYEKLYGHAPEYNEVIYRALPDDKDQVHDMGEAFMKENAALSITYTDTIATQIDDMLTTLDSVIIVLIISAGLLAFVVLYNLNNININERRRELATIKVLGFFDGEVSAYVYRENILITIIGIGAGILLGILMHRFIITTVEVDATMFGRNINWPSFVISSLFTIAFSVFVNVAMHFKLKKIDMVESLKSVE